MAIQPVFPCIRAGASLKQRALERQRAGLAVFPCIRAGASLKHGAGRSGMGGHKVVFPCIRAGASLKPRGAKRPAIKPCGFSPAFVQGPH